MFLLDTNIFSELRKTNNGRANPNVVAWFSQVDASQLYLSPITLLEIEQGILRLDRRDPAQSIILRKWMSASLLPTFSGRILPIDAAVAVRCARLHTPDPRSGNDAWIAATALVHGMTVVTRNVADFTPMGVAVLNPWDAVSSQ